MKQLDPKSVWLFFLSFASRIFIFIVVLSPFLIPFLFSLDARKSIEANDNIVYEFSSFLNWLWIIIPIYLILCFIWAKLTYRFYRYELIDTGFRKESGVIYKKYVTIPYDRIQNVDINRGILARILGLSDLSIQTAGASAMMGRYGAGGIGAEGRLPGLSQKVAEQIRDELIQRARQPKNQGL